jgi:RNA 2',3'-cyclic 3'-phosphodiesterase
VARLFFALWPAAPAAEELERLAREVARSAGGRAVPLDKIHLTVVFLGEVAAERVADAGEVAASLPGADIAVRLDCVGSFAGARAAWAGSSLPAQALRALQSDLARGLRGAGFALEDRSYVPHVTLARRIVRSVPRAVIEPIGWHADELALVRTEAGTGRYTTLGAWPLRRT